jgi:hypothetical protein
VGKVADIGMRDSKGEAGNDIEIFKGYAEDGVSGADALKTDEWGSVDGTYTVIDEISVTIMQLK